MYAKKAFCLLIKRLWTSIVIFSVSSEGWGRRCALSAAAATAAYCLSQRQYSHQTENGGVAKLVNSCICAECKGGKQRIVRARARAHATLLSLSKPDRGGVPLLPRNHGLQGCRHPQGQGQQQLACLIITSKLHSG